MSKTKWFGPAARVAACLLVALAALAIAGGSPAVAQVTDGGGYVTSNNWLALGPFSQAFGCGAQEDILCNHIAPSYLHCEFPEEGDEVDYDPALACTDGYVGPVNADGFPEWRLFSDGLDDCDLNMDEDFNAGVDDDGLVTFVCTYVEYAGASPVDILLCANSDDGVQIWMDEDLVHSNNACRGRSGCAAGGCDDLIPVTVTPGTHRFIMGIWENTGGWGGSLGFRDADGVAIIDGDADWVFLGIDPGDTSPPDECTEPPIALRTVTTPGDASACPPTGGGPASVEIAKPLGGAAAGDAVTVTETFDGLTDTAFITDVSDGGTKELIYPEGVGVNANSFLVTWLLLGPLSRTGGANPGVAAIQLDYLTDGATIETDIVPEDGDTIEPDYNGAAASTGLAATSATLNPGGIPTWTSWTDTDDTISFDEYYGGNVDNNMMYAVSYIFLEEDSDVTLCVGSDDSIQVLIDGVEVFILDVSRGWGNPEQCQNSVPVGILDAGPHQIMLKVFDGGGGHGFRLGFQDTGTGLPLEGLTACTDPDYDPNDAPCPRSPTGSRITWETTRGALAAGLSYKVDVDSGNFPVVGRAGNGPIVGPAAVVIQKTPEDWGPFADPPFDHAHPIGMDCPGTGVTADAGEITITGAGVDIWGTADQFVYAYKEITGEFDAEVTIVNRVMGNSEWGKHGIMVRENCSPGSRYFYCADQQAAAAGGNATAAQWRDAQDVAAAWSGGSPLNAGTHADRLRLARIGNEFVAYAFDPDGSLAGAPGEWVELGRRDWGLDAPETVQLGLAVTSHDACNLVTVTFDDWIVSEGPPPQAPTNAACAGAADGGLDVTWEVKGTVFSEQEIWVNGERAATIGEDERSFHLDAAALPDAEVVNVCVTNDTGMSCCAYSAMEEVNINCGGPRLDEDAGTGIGDGRLWLEDLNEPGGTPSVFLETQPSTVADWSTTGLAIDPAWAPVDTTLVEPEFTDNPDQSRMFATERWADADVVYNVGVPQGNYDVTLLFAEGCCSEGCEDLDDPQESATGNCRVVDLYVNDNLVEDQFSQHVVAQRALADLGLGTPLPNADWAHALAMGPYRVENTGRISIRVADLGAGANPQNASIKGISIAAAGGPTKPQFNRGDANADGTLNITDGIFVLNFLFLGGDTPSCMEAANGNGDDVVNITDGIFILNFLFLGGGAPPPPGPPSDGCGPDNADPDLGCTSYDKC